MKKITVFLFVLLILAVSVICFAHPPTDVKISYFADQGVLTVTYAHLTNNGRKHYVRKIVITRGDGSIEDNYYVRQDEVKDVTKIIPIKLDSGEKIKVKIYCEKGGVAETDYVVPEEPNKTQKNKGEK